MNIKKNIKSGLIFEAIKLDLNNLPRIDSHLHTSWTDGDSSVEDVFSMVLKNKLSTVLYSEHSRKNSTDWFSSFAEEVRQLSSSECKAYVGTEVKVESQKGDIDTVPAITDLCDFVMASVHRFVDEAGNTIQFKDTNPKDAVDFEFKLSWAALANPQVDILGHMFGMSYKRFDVVPPDEKIRQLIERAAKYGVAVEVNSYYHPEPYKIIKWCQEFESLITFGSNAHKLDEVGEVMRLLAREAINA